MILHVYVIISNHEDYDCLQDVCFNIT